MTAGMPSPDSLPADSVFLEKILQLIKLSEEGLRLMDEGTLKRLRTATLQIVKLRYGVNSDFYTEFKRIDSYNSQYTIKEINGLLLAVRDDVEFQHNHQQQRQASTKFQSKEEKLTGLLMAEFYSHGVYNWTAVNNLVLYNSDYFDFTVDDAKNLYQKLIDRRIIAATRVGNAFCITKEGKRFYERRYSEHTKEPTKQNELIQPSTVDVQIHMNEKVNTADTENEVFLSYSWDSPEFQLEVAAFNNFLRENGFHSKMDIMLSEEHTAIDFAKMMHVAIHQSKKVIIILSKGYKDKAENFKGGVGTEYALLFKDIEKSPKKYILVSFEPINENIIPFGLRDREIIDCTKTDWDQKLFAKLKNESRFEFSEVADKQPAVKKIKVNSFIKDVEAKSAETRKQNEARIKASLRMETKVKKELVQKNTDGRVERIGMFPGTFTPFISSRAIIRSAEDKHYPAVDDEPTGKMSSWVREHLYDLSHDGIEIWIGAAMGHDAIMDKDGYWELLSDYDDVRKTDPRYKSFQIMIIGTIPYYSIVELRPKGDDYYNDPHIFCHFDFNDTPYAKIRYQVHYGEDVDLPFNELDITKRKKNEK